ncbi:MAG: hypothetical protein ABW022_17180 [Actinoplanes sp.]
MAIAAAGGLVVEKPVEGPDGRADRDDRAATAERLGATILDSANDMWTRNARVRDPQGAEFTISQFTPPDGF